MRQYAWYSPEIDVIVFQSIMDDRHIGFEWEHSDMVEHLYEFDVEVDAYLWVPLGEV